MDDVSRNQLPDIPQEIFGQIFSILDLPAIHKVREVCKEWKVLVPHVRPNLHFVCHLTDDSCNFAVNSEEILSALHVHDFNGKGNEVMSPTSGTGLLFGTVEIINFTGNNIEPGEIPKMMQFAQDSLKMLEFKNCEIDTLRPFTQAKQTFNALKELSIVYTRVPKENDTLALESLGAPEFGPLLPSLERLQILLDNPDHSRVSSEDMFSNYLAISKIIIKFRGSLKDIEIKRTSKYRRSAGWLMRRGFVLSPAQNTQLQQCLDAFQEMKLNKLSISPENAGHPWVLETQLLRRQQNLMEVVIDHTVGTIDEFPTLTPWLPTNSSSLTIVKIMLTLYAEDGRPSPVDLGAFRGCPNLKTLWLECFDDGDTDDRLWASSSQFSNVEALPTAISSLYLKCDNHNVKNRNWKHQLYFLSQEQIKWIINNLTELESFWAQLVVQPNRPVQQPVAAQNQNWRPNMTLQTFDDLMSKPKLKSLKLDMLKVKQLEARYEDNEEDVVEDKEFNVFVISLGEIQDYIDACKAKPNVTSVSRYPVQSRYFRFWEISIEA